MSICSSLFPVLAAASLLAAIPASAARLRVDINSENRADMCTVGWENWRPSGGDMSQSFGDVTVTLRAGSNGGSIRLSGNKSLVVHGVTVGADGAVAADAKPAVMEIRLEGLAPGPQAAGGDRGGRHSIDSRLAQPCRS